jgi:hypothetical protein
MTLRRYRPFALVLLVLHLTGCQTWQPTTVRPRQLIEEEQPSEIRIIGSAGSQVTLSSPSLKGDSIIGTRVRLRRTETVTVPFSDIDGIAVKRIAGLRTLGAILLIPTLIVATFAVGCVDSCGQF